MSVPDGERIAPVTYLFGTQAEPESDGDNAILSSLEVIDAERINAERFDGERLPTPPSRPSAMGVVQQDEHAEPSPAQANRSDAGKGSFDRISNVSMYALARRGMSSREMHDYLLGREFDPTEVDDELRRLERVSLLDDLALAETLIRTLQARKGLGRSALTAELRRRKIDQIAVESALTVLDDDDELDRATAIAIKRAGQLRSLDATTAKRRLGDFLMRRGYSGSVVSKAVQQALVPSGPTFR